MSLYAEVSVFTFAYTNNLINSMLICLGIYGIFLQIMCRNRVTISLVDY